MVVCDEAQRAVIAELGAQQLRADAVALRDADLRAVAHGEQAVRECKAVGIEHRESVRTHFSQHGAPPVPFPCAH
ncbi:hypothetical protein BLA17378_05424 [Burkholderia aenigmatica]|uniref:Uncharacterized protein n=1 Tax=Burkholderia aenigmatica TaxID=2015348 RepID=A0ABY6XY86_9BURK|nr:hypothetical protein BLA17378_05424 [Burkholderia aenigmatica]